MSEKRLYKLKGSDFIPFYVGVSKYMKRNSDPKDLHDEEVKIRWGTLVLYNNVILLGLSVLSVIGAVKGLEKLVI